MKVLVAGVFSVVLALSGCPVNAGPLQKAQASYLSITNMAGGHSCGATKIGDRTAVTAEHCVDSDFLLEGQKPEKVLLDGKEHALVVVPANLPGSKAKLAHRYPTIGDKLYVWGKPLGYGPLWREGIVAGYVVFPDDPFLAPYGKFTISTMLVAPGDSGSGTWNDKGELVGSVSIGLMATFLRDWSPMGYVPYAFTVEQWKQVR